MPDIGTIKQRALARMRQDAEELERYSCDVSSKEDVFRSNGSLKQSNTKEFERFFVNGQEVDHLLKKNGLALGPGDARKEQSRVDKLVREDSDQKQVAKTEREEVKQIDSFLRALRFTNGHREIRDARSIVVYDLSGDPSFKPSNLMERIAQSLSGRVWIDEETGSPVEMDFRTARDIRLLAGLANVHKGFRLHVTQQMVGDGTWIEKAVDLRGNARELLSTRDVHFQEMTSKCRLYSVEAQSTTEKPAHHK